MKKIETIGTAILVIILVALCIAILYAAAVYFNFEMGKIF